MNILFETEIPGQSRSYKGVEAARTPNGLGSLALAPQPMPAEITDPAEAIEVAKSYAAEECVGTPGDNWDAQEEAGMWTVEFRTHTLTDVYRHTVRMTSIGNITSHDRSATGALDSDSLG